MKLEDYQLVFYHNQWGEDALEQSYDTTRTHVCPLTKLQKDKNVCWEPEWEADGWWNPTFTCKRIDEDGVVLYIRSSTSMEDRRRNEEDVFFSEEGDSWNCSLYGGRTNDGYTVRLEFIEEIKDLTI